VPGLKAREIIRPKRPGLHGHSRKGSGASINQG
jgi:hypothetical protein